MRLRSSEGPKGGPKPKRVPFGQRFVHPSEMSPATRRRLIAAGDHKVIRWCVARKPHEIIQAALHLLPRKR